MPRIVLERRYGAAERAIRAGLIRFNERTLGPQPWKTLAITVRDDRNEVRGGVIGEVWAGWLFVKLLWLDDAVRGENLGRNAMTVLEDEARRRGAHHAYVDTFSFQAPGFYEKLGYQEFGSLDGWPGGHSRHWMTKAL